MASLDHALLQTLYNTGARVQEILDLCPCDLQLSRPRQALLRGKRGKRRCCPLWKGSATFLHELMRAGDVDPADRDPLFRNRSGRPLTPFGVRDILRKLVRTASDSVPTLAAKRVHPHVLRRTHAVHVLRRW